VDLFDPLPASGKDLGTLTKPFNSIPANEQTTDDEKRGMNIGAFFVPHAQPADAQTAAIAFDGQSSAAEALFEIFFPSGSSPAGKTSFSSRKTEISRAAALPKRFRFASGMLPECFRFASGPC
jgi:hypothetical protein